MSFNEKGKKIKKCSGELQREKMVGERKKEEKERKKIEKLKEF